MRGRRGDARFKTMLTLYAPVELFALIDEAAEILQEKEGRKFSRADAVMWCVRYALDNELRRWRAVHY